MPTVRHVLKTYKRKLLEIILLNTSLKHGQIIAELRKPFDMLRDINIAESNKKAPNSLELSASHKWRAVRDEFKKYLITAA